MRQKMLRVTFAVLLLAGMLVGSGCMAHTHVIGNGGSGSEEVEARQWYVLFGLVPINDVDSTVLADGARDYTITTEMSALDVVISIFTSVASVTPRTVTVSK